MKKTSLRRYLFLAPVLGLGCAHAQAPVAPPVESARSSTAKPEAPAAPARVQQDDLDQALRGEVIHFDFDRADLSQESRERLLALAEVLRRHPALSIRIEGNCDERGSEEFNLQLGEQRATAAKRYLANLGIAPERVALISYGKDRPAQPDHTPQAWAENRRDDIRKVAGQ